MIDSPTKTTRKGAHSLKEEVGVLTEEASVPHTLQVSLYSRAQHRAWRVGAARYMFIA